MPRVGWTIGLVIRKHGCQTIHQTYQWFRRHDFFLMPFSELENRFRLLVLKIDNHSITFVKIFDHFYVSPVDLTVLLGQNKTCLKIVYGLFIVYIEMTQVSIMVCSLYNLVHCVDLVYGAKATLEPVLLRRSVLPCDEQDDPCWLLKTAYTNTSNVTSV